MAYDIIGDIHGQADKLESLLAKLGYRQQAGVWTHGCRQVIFVGDFIDRGPAQLRSVEIARRMVENGAALAVMGNHEFNAIAWHTPDPEHPGEFLRKRFSTKWGEKIGVNTSAFWLKQSIFRIFMQVSLAGSKHYHFGLICRKSASCMPAGISRSWIG